MQGVSGVGAQRKHDGETGGLRPSQALDDRDTNGGAAVVDVRAIWQKDSKES
jgi:hypothetical protein